MTAVPEVNAQDKEERFFWESIRCSEEKEVRLYLEEYPKGAYVDEAIRCLRNIGGEAEQDRLMQDPENEIARLLEECEGHLVANRLTTGAGGNALECYRSVLDMEPGNAEALAGLKEIEDTYGRWGRSALERGDIEDAQGNLDKLKVLNPEHRAAEKLEDDIAKLRQEARKARETEEAKQEQEREQQAQDASAAENDSIEDKTASVSPPAPPETHEAQLKLTQDSSGRCYRTSTTIATWGDIGCVATIEIYIDDAQIVDLERDLDSRMNQVVWQGTLQAGRHDIRIKSHYDGKREEEFRGTIDIDNASEITVAIEHEGRYFSNQLDYDFRPRIQVFHGAERLANSRE